MDLPPNVKTNRSDGRFVLLAWRRHSLGLNIGRQNHLMNETGYPPKGTNFFSQGSRCAEIYDFEDGSFYEQSTLRHA